jgi:hypothetical protein
VIVQASALSSWPEVSSIQPENVEQALQVSEYTAILLPVRLSSGSSTDSAIYKPGPPGAPHSFHSFSQFHSPEVTTNGSGNPS